MSVIKYEITPHEQQILDNIKQQILITHNLGGSIADLENITALFSAEIRTFAINLTATYQLLRQQDKYVTVIYIDKLPIFDNTHQGLITSKIFALSLSKVLGEPFQYLQQNNGDIVAEITPAAGLENMNSSGGKVSFDWHSDDSFLVGNHRTKWIQLLGYHNPGEVLTKIATVDDIVRKLNKSTLNLLTQKQFLVKLPSSFDLTSSWSDKISIIRINAEYQYEINVPTYNVKPAIETNQEAWDAIHELIEAANESQQLFYLDKGSLLTFNNDRLLHAREAIKTERLVLRTYIRPNLELLRLHSRNSGRVFDLAHLVAEANDGAI